jgi:phosphatidate cytidylyltransferase
MGTREAFAVIAIPVLIAAVIWLPRPLFLGVLAAAILLAADELLAMARAAELAVGRWLPMVATGCVLAAAWGFGAVGVAVAATAIVVAVPSWQLRHPRAPEGSLTGAATAVLVALYFGLTGACLGWLRVLPEGDLGWRVLLFFLGTIWAGDSGAYYLGKNFGKHRMSPRISPNKTWEGLAGSVVATGAAAAGLSALFALPWSWFHVGAIAAILVAAAPIGDLVESQFKRDTKVKDSSTLIPGHGGFFDRTDSLLLAAPPVLGYLLAAGLVE